VLESLRVFLFLKNIEIMELVGTEILAFVELLQKIKNFDIQYSYEMFIETYNECQTEKEWKSTSKSFELNYTFWHRNYCF
jgi:hypothetical protein